MIRILFDKYIHANLGEENVAKYLNDHGYTKALRQNKRTGDHIYQLLLAFDQLYPTFTEMEQKRFMRAFIDHIDLYPQKAKDRIWICSITFTFHFPWKGMK